MAKKRSPRKRKSDEAPGWVWMLFGLVIGLIVALGVYVNGQRNAELPKTAETTALPAPAAVEAEVRSAPTAGSETARDQPDATRFSFYELLPEFEVVIPDAEAPAPREAPPTAVIEPGRYLIRAGSFQTIGRADARQANVAMLGIESSIQPANVNGTVYYRVLIGPFDNLDELNDTRRRLLDAEIDNDLLRDTATRR